MNKFDQKNSRRQVLKSLSTLPLTPLLANCGGGSISAGKDDMQLIASLSYANTLNAPNATVTPVNKIVAENSLPGTDSWKLTNPIKVMPITDYLTTKDDRLFPCGDFDRNRNLTKLLEGFAYPHSVNAGDSIRFYISTTSPTYSLEIYRMGYYGGKGGRLMKSWANLTVGGSNDPQIYPTTASIPETGSTRNGSYTLQPSDNGIYGNCSKWKPTILDNNTTELVIPSDWVSGYYLGKITESKTGKQSYLIFVVTDHSAEVDIIFQSSLLTWHRYNFWGGAAQYSHAPIGYPQGTHIVQREPASQSYSFTSTPWLSIIKAGEKISLMRPFVPCLSPNGNYGVGAGQFLMNYRGNGTNSIIYAQIDVKRDANGKIISLEPEIPITPVAPTNTDESCSGWEYNTVRFLEANGYNIKYCTAMEIAADKNYLSKGKIYLDSGHDEYFFVEQKDNILYAKNVLGVHGIHLSGNHLYAQEGVPPNDASGKPTPSFSVPYTVYTSNSSSTTDEVRYQLAGGAWTFGAATNQNDYAFVTSSYPSFLLKNTMYKAGSLFGTFKVLGYEADGLGSKWLLYSERFSYMTPMFRCLDNSNFLRRSDYLSPHAGGLYATSVESGAQTFHYNTVNIAWFLDDLILEENATFRKNYKVDANVQNTIKNSINHLTSSRKLQTIQKPNNADAYSVRLIHSIVNGALHLQNSTNNLTSTKLVSIDANAIEQSWTLEWTDPSKNTINEKVYGKFLAANGNDAWFIIRSNVNPSLSLHAIGSNSSLVALPDQNSLRNRWRLIENQALSTQNNRYFLIQNVGTGSFIGINKSTLTGSDFSTGSTVIINAIIDGADILEPIIVRATASINGNSVGLGGVDANNNFKGLEVKLAYNSVTSMLEFSILAARYQYMNYYKNFSETDLNTPKLDAILRTGYQALFAKSKTSNGFGLRNLSFEFSNGKTIYPQYSPLSKASGFIESMNLSCPLGADSPLRNQIDSDFQLIGKANRLDVDHMDLACGLYWNIAI